MKTFNPRAVGVVGAGTMGPGIAQSFALKGLPVRLFDLNPQALARAWERITASLGLFQEEGLVTSGQAETCLANLHPVTSLTDLARDADLIVESVTEEVEVKRRLFAELEDLVPAETILATNTSALSITLIGQGFKNAARLVGLHFWNPPEVLPCVEVIKGEATSEAVFEACVELIAYIGKKPIRVLRDVPGFVGNRLQHALQREAMSLFDQGVVSAEDLDDVVRTGFGLRLALMGPLMRADLGGLDTTLKVQSYLLPFLESGGNPSPGLKKLVAEGRLGLKTGQGYYDWPADRAGEMVRRRDRLLLRLLKLVKPLED